MKKSLYMILALGMVLGVAGFAMAGSSKKASSSNSTSASATKGEWKGYISDEKCGAKVNADCAKRCVEAGKKAVFVTDKDKSILAIDNQDAVKDHVGHHVDVKGTVSNGTLHVDSVSMIADNSKSGSGGKS